jgi:hypothetical protein
MKPFSVLCLVLLNYYYAHAFLVNAPVRAAHTLRAIDATQVAEVAAVAGALYVARGAIGLISVAKLADFRTPRGHDTDLTQLKKYGLKVSEAFLKHCSIHC